MSAMNRSERSCSPWSTQIISFFSISNTALVQSRSQSPTPTQRLADGGGERSYLPSEEIIAELCQAALRFANGTKQKDDLTAVVLKQVATQATRRKKQVRTDSGARAS
jgi:hypothetical protein